MNSINFSNNDLFFFNFFFIYPGSDQSLFKNSMSYFVKSQTIGPKMHLSPISIIKSLRNGLWTWILDIWKSQVKNLLTWRRKINIRISKLQLKSKILPQNPSSKLKIRKYCNNFTRLNCFVFYTINLTQTINFSIQDRFKWLHVSTNHRRMIYNMT
jgi:hypothetical protein